MFLKHFSHFIKLEINKKYKEFPLEKLEIELNAEEKRLAFGDISINAALIIAKIENKNPLLIAKDLQISLFDKTKIEKIEIAGNGFLNFFFKQELFHEFLSLLLTQKIQLIEKTTTREKYNIEFVSANPTGPLHIGHGRGAIIGDVLAKIFKRKGYLIHTEFYINDAGNQIEKLGLSLLAMYKTISGTPTDIPENGYQGYYIKDIAEELYNKNKKINTNDAAFFSEYAKDNLLEKLQETLEKYHVCFDCWFSEKSLHLSNTIDRAVAKLTEKGYIYQTDDQTIWFRATSFGDEKDRVLKKQDGLWTYTAADIAYLINKIERGYTKIIMVLGQDHHSFKIRLEAIAKALGFNTQNLHIILYQLVTLKNDGELIRMSKRKGTSVELEHIIDTVGSDVARFFYLNKKADAHLDFDLKEALEKNNNNPVFYIQYALVRMKSIFEKTTGLINQKELLTLNEEIPFSDIEKILLKKLSQYNDTLDICITELTPHLLTYYTLQLTTLFHSWYRAEQIICQDNTEKTRQKLAIMSILYQALTESATILGISIPEKM